MVQLKFDKREPCMGSSSMIRSSVGLTPWPWPVVCKEPHRGATSKVDVLTLTQLSEKHISQ